MRLTSISLLLVLPFLGGCNKDESTDDTETGIETGTDTGETGDTEVDEVQSLSFSNPSDGSILAPGDTLNVEADVAGNYKVENLTVALRIDSTIIDDYTFDAGSLSFTHTVGIGEETAVLEITDDNETHQTQVSWIGNTLPVIELDEPDYVGQGEPVIITGTVTDGETAPEDLLLTWLFDGVFYLDGLADADGNISLEIPEAPAGSHTVELVAEDGFGSSSESIDLDAECTLASSIQTLLHLNEEGGDAPKDSSLNEVNAEVVGNATVEAGIDGNALNLGGEAYVAMFDTPYPPLWATNFTIGGWVKPNTPIGTGNETIFQQLDGSSQDANDTGTGLARTMLYRSPGCGGALSSYIGAQTLCGSTALQEGVWQHVAITRNRDTGKVALFLNGIKEAEGTRFMEYADGGLVLGIGKTLTNQHFNGAVDEVMVLSEAMDEAGLTALIDGGPPICKPECVDLPSSPFHWYEGTAGTNNDVEDLIGNTNADLLGNATFGPGTNGDGLILDGIDSYATIDPATSLQLSSTDFTISMRVRFDGGNFESSEDHTLFQLLDGSGLGRTMIYVDGSCGGQVSSFLGGQELCSGSLYPGLWHHVVLRVDQTNATAQFFLDGVGQQVASRTMASSDGGIQIGRGKSIAGQYWNGAIDDLMIYDSYLTDEEIVGLHEAGTNYCPLP